MVSQALRAKPTTTLKLVTISRAIAVAGWSNAEKGVYDVSLAIHARYGHAE